MQRRLAASAVYLEPRVVAMLLLGCSSGLPQGIGGPTLSVRLMGAGHANSGRPVVSDSFSPPKRRQRPHSADDLNR